MRGIAFGDNSLSSSAHTATQRYTDNEIDDDAGFSFSVDQSFEGKSVVFGRAIVRLPTFINILFWIKEYVLSQTLEEITI